MRFLPKLLLTLFFFLLLSFSFLAYTSSSRAEIQPFPPGNIPCNATYDPNFHSLRPYQANPCNSEIQDTALFCGNDLILGDTIIAPRSIAKYCIQHGCSETCFFSIQREMKLAIDILGELTSDAELPIAGNTELVKNSQNGREQLDDAQKVNEYVSWFLNGITNKAEEPFVGTKDPADIAKIVNFSGPLNKLLPQEIQFRARIDTVEKALKGEERHDQIVGCTYPFGVPGPCYDKGIVSALIPEEAHWLSEWEGHFPPLREDYETFGQYQKAMQNWRGKLCFPITIPSFIPFLGGKEILLLCGLENPLSPNYYANLFPYIPLSSTEDRKGDTEVSTIKVYNSGGTSISNIKFANQVPATLFFAHMEEIRDLATLLQSTFAAKGLEQTGGGSSLPSGPSCDLVQVRSNPGDDLFPGEITGDFSYLAEFTCVFPMIKICPGDEGRLGGGSGEVGCYCVPDLSAFCVRKPSFRFSTLTQTPLIDEIYSRLVNGPAAAFKRIFPKIGEGGPLKEILDIPGATKVHYKVDPLALLSVGNPGNQRDPGEGELYFPHLGSLYEYFLKGIQTVLRPRGYGEPILSGEPQTLPGDPTPKEKGGKVDCNKNAQATTLNGVIGKDEFAGIAGRWISSANFAADCYYDVIAKAKAAGVNPAYALAVWLLESGASNYGSSVEDFGVHSASVRGFNAQIQAFLNIVAGATSLKASNYPQWNGNTLKGYLFYYNTGEYDPKDPEYQKLYEQGTNYYNAFLDVWRNFVAPGCPLPTGPLDNSCP